MGMENDDVKLQTLAERGPVCRNFLSYHKA